jgi:hypothetical protein
VPLGCGDRARVFGHLRPKAPLDVADASGARSLGQVVSAAPHNARRAFAILRSAQCHVFDAVTVPRLALMAVSWRSRSSCGNSPRKETGKVLAARR